MFKRLFKEIGVNFLELIINLAPESCWFCYSNGLGIGCKPMRRLFSDGVVCPKSEEKMIFRKILCYPIPHERVASDMRVF